MSKKTSYHSKNGRITGKTVRDGNKTTHYKAVDRPFRVLFGPGYKATSTTTRDSKGNTRTKTY